MTRILSVLAAIWLCVLLSLGQRPVSAAGPQSQAAPPAATKTPQRALLDRYCVSCHNTRLKTADLSLDVMDIANVGADAATWEKVVRKFGGGQMPPANLPRPDEATREGFVSWLAGELDK